MKPEADDGAPTSAGKTRGHVQAPVPRLEHPHVGGEWFLPASGQHARRGYRARLRYA